MCAYDRRGRGDGGHKRHAYQDSGVLRVGGGRHGKSADLEHRAPYDRGGGWHLGGIIIAMYLPMFRIFDLVQ